MLPFGTSSAVREKRRSRGRIVVPSGTIERTKPHRLRLVLIAVGIITLFIFWHWSSSPTHDNEQQRRATFSSRPGSSREKLKQQTRRPTVFDEPPIEDTNQLLFRTRSHTYRDDGLVEVSPNGSHPIFELIARAETAWETKKRRASATLEEAVEEYVRRYKRNPPLGFDKWWEYAQEHSVKLPDEYDSIHERLEPFWGVNPRELRETLADWEDESDVPTMVFGKTPGSKSVRILKNGMPEADKTMFALSIMERIELLRDVEEDLPEFRAVISPADTPNLLKDWESIERARKAASLKTTIKTNKYAEPKHGWLVACPPGSPVYDRHHDFYAPAPKEYLAPKTKTFIHDHVKAMDPCSHPGHLYLEGQFISHNEGPSPHRRLIPQFSSSATSLHYDLLPIPPAGWGEERRDIPWEDKEDERLLWRGLNTGMLCNSGNRWQQSQRIRLVQMTNDVTGEIEVLIPPESPGEESTQVGMPVRMKRSRVNPAIMDIAFSGSPVQCDAASCDELRRDFDWKRHMPLEESQRYKYIIDVDGNGWSSRFKRLMASNAVVFKSTVYPEWFADRIQPWLHYVPVSLDYSDLHDVFLFFRGGLNGEGNHDTLAKKIAYAGSEWADTFWREEDATAYMYRLILEYARVISLDREAMTYKGPTAHEHLRS